MNDVVVYNAPPSPTVGTVEHNYHRKDVAKAIMKDIDQFALDKWNDGFRNHLGASLIGQECTRATWYGYHWMALPAHNGRMQRLFQRGHLEEFRYVEYLEGIGAQVWPVDPATGKQFRVSKVGGHFGGSLDAIVQLPPRYNIPFPILGEFKTKGTGSGFTKLRSDGIQASNPQHFDQMSTYGAAYNLPYSLYMSTNKNDDDMHVEIVPLDFKRAAEVEEKARYIISQQVPPPRISLNPTFWKCKGCDFAGVCHHNHVPVKNCRTCTYSCPVDNAQWYCRGHGAVIPEHVMKAGCDRWTFIPSPPG